MVPVDLCDVIHFIPIPQGIELVSEGYPVPADDTNLVCRAARTLLSRTGYAKGVSIRLTKNIPVAAGMGGGSSDAAVTLLSLNRMWGYPLPFSQLRSIALQLGADVPFFLNARPALASGIGEILEPIQRWPDFWYVIVTPPIRVSSGWVYGNLKLQLTTGEYDYIVNILEKADYPICLVMENDLETVTSAAFPVINTIKELLLDAGAEGALMSGSGPSVFGVFPSLDQARAARDFLCSQCVGDVFLVTTWGSERSAGFDQNSSHES
jgi:4-diphosphocytidyl-2-C-methyl-D-erythritol kinase